MQYRWSEILSSETFTAAGTKVIDIDLSDPISRLSILMKLTNNGSTPTDHPAKALVKVEIVDGSDVLCSLSGLEAQALAFYTQRKPSFADLIYLNDVMALIEFDIYFGRFLFDPDLALDTTKFRNPQIKISHSLGLGGSAPDALDMRVRADVFDDKKVSPSGFLMAKELYSYSLVSGANEYIDLPNDHPVRNLTILSRANGKAPHEQYNQLKLTENQDKKTILEGYTSDFQKVIAGLFPEYQDKIYGAASAAGVEHYFTPTFDVYPSLNAEGTSAQIYTAAFNEGGKQAIHGDVNANFYGLMTGRCPHGAIVFPMGNPDDPSDWWDVSALTSARLKITAGSSVESSSTLQLVLEQLRRY